MCRTSASRKSNRKSNRKSCRIPEVMPKVLEIKHPDGESIANGKPVMAEVQKAENPAPTKGGTESGVKSSTPGPSLQGTGETVTSPKFGVAYLNNPKPGYPAFARRMGMEGTVMLKVLVSRQGTALKIEIAHSSGHEILDKAAADDSAKLAFCSREKGEFPHGGMGEGTGGVSFANIK